MSMKRNTPFDSAGCKDCKFWVPLDKKEGECRRYPPAVMWSEATENYHLAFSQSQAGEWCGEFKPRLDD